MLKVFSVHWLLQSTTGIFKYLARWDLHFVYNSFSFFLTRSSTQARVSSRHKSVLIKNTTKICSLTEGRFFLVARSWRGDNSEILAKILSGKNSVRESQQEICGPSRILAVSRYPPRILAGAHRAKNPSCKNWRKNYQPARTLAGSRFPPWSWQDCTWEKFLE